MLIAKLISNQYQNTSTKWLRFENNSKVQNSQNKQFSILFQLDS